MEALSVLGSLETQRRDPKSRGSAGQPSEPPVAGRRPIQLFCAYLSQTVELIFELFLYDACRVELRDCSSFSANAVGSVRARTIAC